MPGGRPTDFKPEFNKQVEQLCYLGATDAQLGEFFNVTETTINNWKKAHVEFFESIKRAKAEADTEVVKSLYKRAVGFEFTEFHQEGLAVKDEKGNVIPGKIQTKSVKQIKKHVAPDTAAAFIWLKNRRPLEWKDKKDIDVTTGGQKIGNPSWFDEPAKDE